MAVANPSPLVAPVMRTLFPLIDISLCGTAEEPSSARAQAPTKPATRSGRPTADVTQRVYARWVELGKPKLTKNVADDLATDFCPVDFSRTDLYSGGRRTLRDRIRAMIGRHSKKSKAAAA